MRSLESPLVLSVHIRIIFLYIAFNQFNIINIDRPLNAVREVNQWEASFYSEQCNRYNTSYILDDITFKLINHNANHGISNAYLNLLKNIKTTKIICNKSSIANSS